ncbi:MAG: ankyrin repeat domain-containing protein [Alphaproteobacteria bacterium]
MNNGNSLRNVFLAAVLGGVLGGGIVGGIMMQRDPADRKAQTVETDVALSPAKKQAALNLELFRAVYDKQLAEEDAIARAKDLLDRGADINAGIHGTALHDVVGRPDHPLKLAKFLIDNGASLDIATSDYGETPLMNLISSITFNGNEPMTAQDTAMLNLLLASGAARNTQDTRGQTALHYAAINTMVGEGGSLPVPGKFIALAEILKSAGVNPLIRDNDGKTALDIIKGEAADQKDAIDYLQKWEQQLTKKPAGPGLGRG